MFVLQIQWRLWRRDLAALESKGLLRHEGETTNLVYRPSDNWESRLATILRHILRRPRAISGDTRVHLLNDVSDND